MKRLLAAAWKDLASPSTYLALALGFVAFFLAKVFMFPEEDLSSVKLFFLCLVPMVFLVFLYHLASIQKHAQSLYHVALYREARDNVKQAPDLAAKWIHVNDHMPPVNVPVLVYCLGRCGVASLVPDYAQEGVFFFNGHGGPHNAVTHWMELPMTPPPVDDD